MNISLTSKEYKLWLELLLLGAYIIEKSDCEEKDKYFKVLKYILSDKRSNSDYKDNCYITFNEINNILLRDIDLKEEYIESYNENMFWNELSDKLATKDAFEKIGEEITEDNYEEFLKLKKDIINKYIENFKESNYHIKELPY
ncbi:hypothetical protein [Clostridium fallax]|uniref:Uncharacterized protein n=1 Tax=Clostridium fallax TaxID=1533 RepID=A0A1M4SVK4_9CLOT|nr:hypothetical protein [Clostridium fallax]SHE36199.1 hypothetical protein SAMN05443638_101197 [Clostridium fallax]SQB07992.1 Uncharacterised protein [Clostridium fallax]